ncbi:MAG: DUF5615 family PIN-like protein [Acidobacteria bacterium]|nr:DUF5615 family PIN-like protein [Acidobacteriota bacterium]
MRFLVDECTGPTVAKWLRENGHQVFSVYEETQGVADEQLLSKAVDENWILITNDKDFGEMVFRERRPHRGVVFLRLGDERSANKIHVLRHLLENYSDKLRNNFVTVTETKVRVA